MPRKSKVKKRKSDLSSNKKLIYFLAGIATALVIGYFIFLVVLDVDLLRLAPRGETPRGSSGSGGSVERGSGILPIDGNEPGPEPPEERECFKDKCEPFPGTVPGPNSAGGTLYKCEDENGDGKKELNYLTSCTNGCNFEMDACFKIGQCINKDNERHDCSEGETGCVNLQIKKICGDADGDSCRDFLTKEICPDNTYCSNGECKPINCEPIQAVCALGNCPNECLYPCENNEIRACPEGTEEEVEEEVEKGTDPECSDPCTENECSGNHIQTCVNNCKGVVVKCPTGESCTKESGEAECKANQITCSENCQAQGGTCQVTPSGVECLLPPSGFFESLFGGR